MEWIKQRWFSTANNTCSVFRISGWSGCGYLERAKGDAKTIASTDGVKVVVSEVPRAEWPTRVQTLQQTFGGSGGEAASHRTSPYITEHKYACACDKLKDTVALSQSTATGAPAPPAKESVAFVGGASDFRALLTKRFPNISFD